MLGFLTRWQRYPCQFITTTLIFKATEIFDITVLNAQWFLMLNNDQVCKNLFMQLQCLQVKEAISYNFTFERRQTLL